MKNPILTLTVALLVVAGSIQAQDKAAPAPAGNLQQAASKMVLPKVDFRESTVREALEFLQQRSKALDPQGRGINVILKGDSPRLPALPPGPPPNVPGIPGLDVPGVPAAAVLAQAGGTTKITLSLENVPLTEVLKYIANLADHRIRWDEHAVMFIAPKPGKREVPDAKPRPELKVAAEPKAVMEKIKKIVLPKVDFKEATPREAFDFLMQRARSLEPEPAPFNFVLKLDGPEELSRVTFAANNLPLLEVIRYTAELSGLEVTMDPTAIVVAPPKKP